MTVDEAVGTRANREGRRKRWAFRPYCQFTLRRTVDSVDYLKRWWIFDTPIGGLAVHRMLAPDVRMTLHDHPFAFVSLVVKGGYTERRLIPLTGGSETRLIRRWRINWKRTYDAHTITGCAVPTWTVLLCGRPVRRWGFLSPICGPHHAHEPPPDYREHAWTDHQQFNSGHYVP